MPSNVNITISKKFRFFKGRHEYVWRAVSANGRKLAAGRNSYKDKDDVIHILHVLFGPKFGGHKVFDRTGEDA